MKIDANSISLYNFFTEESDPILKKYVSPKIQIPAFQRNYAWDKKHVKELINSIKDSNIEYYIGNILIQRSRGVANPDLIIDGQQRLTTLFLILKSLENFDLNKKNRELLKELIFYNQKKEITRIEFSRPNLSDSFDRIVVFNDLTLESFLDDNSKKFLNNFLFIKKELLSIDDINIFFNKIINLIFVVIKFDDGFDVNQLFEGLNSKGKILSAIQLTKNALIGSTKNSSYNDEIISIWENMESNFEQSKSVIWFDKFLRHLGFLKYGYVSNKDLFKRIKGEIKLQDDLLSFSKNLQSDALLYLKIRKGDLIKSDISIKISEADWISISFIIKHISTMDLDQVYSILFASVKFAKKNIDYSKGINSRFFRDLKKIWSFSILVKFLDTKPSLFERAFSDFSHNLYLGNYKKSQSLFTILNKIIKDSNENKFIDNLNSRIKITGDDEKKITSKNNRNFISPLLMFYLTQGKNFLINDCSIEHIIPKKGLNNWDIGEKYLNNVKRNSRYKMGNLTLLKKDSIGDSSFLNKIEFYKKDILGKKDKSIIKYKKDFISTDPSQAVDKRGNYVGKILYNLLIKNLD